MSLYFPSSTRLSFSLGVSAILLFLVVSPIQAQEATPPDEVVSAPADLTPPATPANITVSAVSSSELDLSWSPATDNVAVTGYRLYRRSVSTGPDSLLATLGTVTTYADTGLAAGTKFWYSLSAIDAAGNESGVSPLRSGRTLAIVVDTTPPSIPTGLTVTATSSSQLHLVWDPATDAVGVTGYKVYKRVTSSGPDELLGTVTERTYDDTGLLPYTKFWYVVSAIDAAGNESGKSELRSGRTLADPATDLTPPTTPVNITVSAVSSSELDLSWSPATDNVAVTGYRLYRRSVSTGPDSLLATLGTVTTYADTGLAAGTKFWYSLSAIDAAGNESGVSPLRSGRTWVGNGDADLPAGTYGPDITVGIFNYTTSDLRSSSLRVTADRPFAIVKKSGEKVIDVPADKNIRVSYLGNQTFRIYDPDTDVTIDELTKEVRFEAADPGAVFDISRPGSSYDRYRGDIKLRYYDSPEADGDRIWVINTIPLEHYTWGMGEITGTGPAEYNKVMTTIFRTYGYWKIKWSTKYADQGFKVDATSGSQIYWGYDWEVAHPDIRKGAEATSGQLVMYNGKVALTAYSSWTDGKTRRFEDGHWGHVCTTPTGTVSSVYPWLSSVSDPDGKHPTESTCSLAGSGNHMVGLSANGAVRMAKYSGRDARFILTHYFTGIALLKAY